MKMKRIVAALAAAWFAMAPAQAAEQASYQAPSTGPMSMSTFVSTYLNPALRALATCNWGPTAPANGPGSAAAGLQCWWDTSGSPYVLKWYVNAQWTAVANIDAGTNAFTIPGHIIGTNVQAFDAELAALAGLTSANNKCFYWTGSATAATFDCSSFGRSVVNAADASALRTLAGSVIGTDVQAFDAELAALAGLTSANNKCFYFTGSGTAATFDCSSFGRSVANAADASALRTLAGSVIGTDVQAFDTDLAALAANATNGLWARTGAGTGAARTITGTTNEVCVTNGDGVSGNPTLGICAGWLSTAHSWAGAQTFAAPITTGLFDIQGALKFSTQSAPAQITSNQNDYNPSSVNCTTSATVLINSDAARDVTGLAGGATGCLMRYVNNGSFTITFKEESGSSTAANRFKSGGDIALAASAAVTFLYDGSASRWRMASPAATGGGSGTMTSLSPGAGLQNAGTTNPVTTSGTLSVDGSFTFRNRLINPNGRIWQVQNTGAAAITDGTYAFDQWYGLTQSAGVTASQVTGAENGMPYMMRLSQANASAQRFGLAQPIEAANAQELRGKAMVLSARVRMSASTTLRYALVEWTGSTDAPTKDVVNDWTSGTFTTGNFFISTTTTICGTGSTALTANTLTDVSLTCTFGSSTNNVIAFFWTDSTQAQNVTLDIGKAQLEAGLSPTAFASRPMAIEVNLVQRYYQKTYDLDTAPGSVTATGQLAARSPVTAGSAIDTFQKGVLARFRTAPTVTWYSPATGTAARVRDVTGAADVTVTGTSGNGETQAGYPTCSGCGPTAGNFLNAHYTADARL